MNEHGYKAWANILYLKISQFQLAFINHGIDHPKFREEMLALFMEMNEFWQWGQESEK